MSLNKYTITIQFGKIINRKDLASLAKAIIILENRIIENKEMKMRISKSRTLSDFKS